MTPITPLQKHLAEIHACQEARGWAAERTAQQAWDECGRADWLLWWAAKTTVNTHQDIVRVACACAWRALRFVPEGEQRPRLAIEAAERWTSDPTPGNRRAAAAEAAWEVAASVAVAAAAWEAASEASEAASGASEAAAEAAWEAAEAASEAAEAAWAAWAAAEAAAASEQLAMCQIVRGTLHAPWTEAA